MGMMPSRKLEEVEHGAKIWVGGMVVSHQRPPTAKGVAFLALEDKGELVNVVLRSKVYKESRKVLRSMYVGWRGS
jgi:error-prone DNA polymerase